MYWGGEEQNEKDNKKREKMSKALRNKIQSQ